MAENRPVNVADDAEWDPSDREWVRAIPDREGRKHGLVTYWRADGSIVNHCNFEHGAPHGWYKRYHQSGDVSRQGTFVKGALHGTDVFFRSDEPTTENFPAGLSTKVWRAEMDMVHGRIVAGRCFDRDGRRVSDGGEPIPDRPVVVPETASFSSDSQRWLAGETDNEDERNGLWQYWNKHGVLVQETLFQHGSEVWTHAYADQDEADAESALRDARLEDALGAARRRWTRVQQGDDSAEIAAAGGLLLRVLQAHSPEQRESHRDEGLAVAHAVEGVGVGAGWGPFMESGKRGYLGRQLALDTLATDLLERGQRANDLAEALALSDLAIECDFHYGQDAARVTKVRILKKLGRDDEAFALAREVLLRTPDVAGLDDIRNRPEFTDWLASLRTDTMTLDGAWELLGHAGTRLEALAQPIIEPDDASGEDSDEAEKDEAEDGEDADACEADVPWEIGAALGDNLSPELRRWDDLLRRKSLRGTYRGELSPPVASTLSGAIANQDGKWVARLQGLFCAMSPVLSEDEEMYFACWHPTPSGESPVFYSHQDEVEIGQTTPALAGFLVDRMLEDTAFERSLAIPAQAKERWKRALELLREAPAADVPEHLDPAHLQARTGWVVALFLGVDVGPGLEAAPDLTVWAHERELCKSWPHLAAYWLLHHLVFDNREELPFLIETADRRYPASLELAGLAEAVVAGNAVAADFWDEVRLQGFRVEALDAGKTQVFTEPALTRLQAATAERTRTEGAAKQALEALRALNDPKIAETLEAWGLLESAAGSIPAYEQALVQQWFKDDQDESMSYFMRIRTGHTSALLQVVSQVADRVDARWRDYFDAVVQKGAAFEETHKSAVPGALAGLGVAMGDFAAFMTRVQALPFYPDQNGRMRRAEQSIVAKKLFDQGEAPRQLLIDEAQRFVAQINEWETDTTAGALSYLIEADQAEGYELVGEMLSNASFNGANWQTCIKYAVRCGNHRGRAITPALLRAVDKGLGRHDDAERAEVIRAFAGAAGPDAVPELEKRLHNIEDVRKECERAALLAALVLVEPGDRWQLDCHAALDELLAKGLGSMELGAAVSLLKAIHAAKMPGFKTVADTIIERAKRDEDAKPKLVAWMEKNVPDLAA